jgi:hypothetical protein
MKTQHFQCHMTTESTAKDALKKISQVSAWWAKVVEGKAEKANDVFTVRFGDTFVTFRVTAFSENKIVWLVTDCFLPWQNNKTEWTGTEVQYELTEKNGHTDILFTHVGLVPEVECYDQCSTGWTKHIEGSLAKLMDQGIGVPV